MKYFADRQQSMKYKSTTTKTSWPALTATSSKDIQIGANSIGPTIQGKLGCPNKKKKKMKLARQGTRIFTTVNEPYLDSLGVKHHPIHIIYKLTRCAWQNCYTTLRLGCTVVRHLTDKPRVKGSWHREKTI